MTKTDDTKDDREFVQRVGQIIMRERNDKGLSRERVAEAARVSPSMLAQLELYGNKGVSLQNARNICDAIGCSLEFVLAEASSHAQLRAAIVQTFAESPWRDSEDVREDELAWLRSIPIEKCIGTNPPPRAVLHLIEALRQSKKPAA